MYGLEFDYCVFYVLAVSLKPLSDINVVALILKTTVVREKHR